jgi:hypothetical protein
VKRDGPADVQRYFFVHVMKTGGRTFSWRARANFRAAEIYPSGEEPDLFEASTNFTLLARLPEARRRQVRFYCGHFPLMAADLVGPDVVTMTMLRNPVDRTISYLKHVKRRDPRYAAKTLEQIYDDPWIFPMYLHDHQVKVFSLCAADAPTYYFHAIDVDAERLESAKSNLRTVDVVGLTERSPEFAQEITRQYGWSFSDLDDMNVSTEDWPVSPALRERILTDNAIDMEFYEFARALVDERLASQTNAAGERTP